MRSVQQEPDGVAGSAGTEASRERPNAVVANDAPGSDASKVTALRIARKAEKARKQQRALARALAVSQQAPEEGRRKELPQPARPQQPMGWASEALVLPRRTRRRSYGTILSFILCVALPTIASAIYFVGIASDQYVVEFKFAVRDAQSAAGTGISGQLNLGGFGVSTAPNPLENYIVTEFLKSRQAVDELQAKIDVTHLYSRPDIDWWARFDASKPIEKFVTYWQKMMSASYDQVTGTAIAEVRAFSPQDAYLIGSTLVTMSEELINKISNRPQRDAVRFAEDDVRRAEARLKTVRAELTRFRNSEQLIDPQANVVTSNVLLAQSLRGTISQLQTDLAALQKDKNLHRDAPPIVSLQTRIKSTQEQLAAIEGQVRNMRDGNNPLSKVVAEFEQLDLERQFAQNMVLSTMQKLEEARASLLAQHIYVTPFVNPAMPQSSTYPRRLISIAITAFVCLLFWVIGLLLVRSIREHLN